MIENLLKYQQADAKLREIEMELAKSEERKKAVEAKKYLNGVETTVNKLDDKAADLLSAYEKLKSTKAKLEEQKEEFTKALDSIEDTTGANFIIKKAEELIARIKATAATVKNLEEEISQIGKEYALIRKRTKEEQEKYKENATKYNEFKASFKEKNEEIEKELSSLKKSVDSALMDKYTRKRENKIYPVLFEVEEHGKDNNVCGYCKMELSLSEVSKLKSGEIIECASCGRLIYKKK